MNIVKKICCAVTAFSLLMLMGVNAFCQDPCLPSDPDDPTSTGQCPLDSWVFVIVAAAVVFVVWHMRKQQSELANSQ